MHTSTEYPIVRAVNAWFGLVTVTCNSLHILSTVHAAARDIFRFLPVKSKMLQLETEESEFISYAKCSLLEVMKVGGTPVGLSHWSWEYALLFDWEDALIVDWEEGLLGLRILRICSVTGLEGSLAIRLRGGMFCYWTESYASLFILKLCFAIGPRVCSAIGTKGSFSNWSGKILC